MLVLSVVIFLAVHPGLSYEQNSKREMGSLERSHTTGNLRISFQVLPGYFSVPHYTELIDRIAPATAEFYASAIKVNNIIGPLKPSVKYCHNVQVPEADMKAGFDADIIIYIHSNITYDWPASGKSCEQEFSIYKRPLVGQIEINPDSFFSLYKNSQIQYLIRETAHVVALDFDLFKDFVQYDGSGYSKSQRSIQINYLKRGKTVNAIAFPRMLLRARLAFNCDLEGLETEDYFEEELLSQKIFFWDGRVMPQDIMVSKLSSDVIFSDITMALFEDSGWYTPDYSYSQVIKWGNMAGCKWHDDTCIQQGSSVLEGFCDLNTKPNQCDALGMGYGDCYITADEGIPINEAYFANSSLGGKEYMDYCPTIEVPELNKCRDSTKRENSAIGEKKGLKSRCFTSTLTKPNESSRSPQGACYQLETCTEEFAVIVVGDYKVDCLYNSKVTVKGFSGLLNCPNSLEFCQNLPCLNMCSGRGKCIHGVCYCNNGWGGTDCSLECGKTCATCSDTYQCTACRDGYFMSNKDCLPCSSMCKTCKFSESTCTSCNEGDELVGDKCKGYCIEHCATCDSPCSKCDVGFFLSEQKCEKCDESCKECAKSSLNCISCFPNFVLDAGSCKPGCLPGCVSCGYPCKSCKTGYLLSNDKCELCDNVCKECSVTVFNCISCFDGYVLSKSTCVSTCKPNCLSCDDPCTKCENQFYLDQGQCFSCGPNCLNCLNPSICTSCRAGFILQGSSCEKECVDNCETCKFPCQKCLPGYLLEFGKCSKCTTNCKTCEYFIDYCLSCPDGYGLVHNNCEKDCADHCVSCDSPCSQCETGYFPSKGSCIICDNACLTCSGPGNNACIDCKVGYYKSENTCTPVCQEHCTSCDEPCSSCEPGYYPFQLGCGKCNSLCLTCKTLNQCESCKEGFGLVDSSCRSGCLDHCLSCDNPCSLCEAGYYKQQGMCKKCSNDCLTCEENPNMCTSCSVGYKLEGDKCKVTCIDNCITCDYPCTACSLGYVSVIGYCYSCPVGCGTCNSELTKCYSCTQGYILYQDECKKLCLPNCKSCDEPCTECDSGFINQNGMCLSCIYPCKSCLGSQDFCTSCVNQFKLIGNTCKSECLENCRTCSNPCTECTDGFTLVSGTCVRCDSNCRTCSNSPSQCTSCGIFMSLIEGKCVSSCIENCEDCSFPCTKCKDNYEFVDNSCVECQEFLSESEISAEFIKDFTGISIEFAASVKYLQNDCKHMFKIQTITMMGLNPQCNWLSDRNFVVVFGDKPDLNIRTLEMFPIAGLGNSCSKPKSELNVKIVLKEVTKPLISISAPDKFTLGCDNQVLVIQGFTNEDIFEFDLKTMPSLPINSNFFEYLSGKILIIPENKFTECHLTVTFSATNIFGMTSKIVKVIQITKIQDFSVYIDAGSHLELSSSETFTIRGIVSETSCVDYEKLSFKWEYVLVENNELKNVNELIEQSGLPNMLRIPKGSLTAGKEYIFRFSVTDQSASAFSEINIKVVHGPLDVQIDRSDSSHSINEDLVLTATSNFISYARESALVYEWSCDEDNKPCKDSYGQDLLTNYQGSQLKVSKYRMELNKKYYFTVKLTNGLKIASKSILITVNIQAGYINIPTMSDSVNIQRQFTVFPEFKNIDRELEFKWMQINGPAVKPASKSQSSYLLIKENDMVAGRMYKFQISGKSMNETIYSNLMWITNTGPNCGLYTTQVVDNTVTYSIDCRDGDHKDYPLLYIYGVKNDMNFMPLKVIHSPSTTIKLNPGKWTVYTDICDSLQSCIRKQNNIEIQGKRLLSDEKSAFDKQKLFPDNLPLAIFNAKGLFTTENFEKTLKELENYIEVQEIDLIHLKICIESLEILTEFNKTHFMQKYQKDIVLFLTKIVKKISSIDDDTMYYIVNLFSEHQIVHYDLVSVLLGEYSAKWVKQMPPGESKKLENRISLIRHRFIGEDFQELYQFESLNISNLNLQGNKNTIYDLLIVVYPSDIVPIIHIVYYQIGTYSFYNTKFNQSYKKLLPDLNEPFFVNYYSNVTKDLSCVQLRGDSWIEEGCSIQKLKNSTIRLSSWHISTYKVVNSSSTHIGLYAIVTEAIMLNLTIFFVTVFCVVDKSKYTLLPQYKDYQGFTSPRGQEKHEEGKIEYEIVDGEKVPVERKNPVRASFEELREPVVHIIVYHPFFNISQQQNGERRAASLLHFSSVMFCEFAVFGIVFNPDLHQLFDSEGKFNGFSSQQILITIIGILFVQVFSLVLMFLNQVDDTTVTKRYVGMALSTLAIIISSVVGIVLAVSYPSKYSFFWVVTFLMFSLIDLLLLQSLYWAINIKVFKRDLALTRNIRVFTSDS